MTRSRLAFLVTHGVTANRLLKGQLAYLRKNGFDVTVIASPGADLDAVREREGVDVVGVEMSRRVRLHEGPLVLARIARELRRLNPDIVNASTPKAGLLGMLAARALGIRRRIFLLRGLRFEGFTGAARTLLMGTDRIAAACAHDIVCVSDSVRRAVLTSRISPPSKTTTIPSNGIDASRFRSRSMTRESARKTRADLGIPPDAVVAGFVGRLVPEKGVEDMLSALEAATNVWLLLVGGDLAGDALPQSITDRLAHPRVVRVGPVDDPAPYYEAMDLLLFPSYREGLPNVPLEAAASELPVIGYRVTGVVDAVVDGETGLLVPVRDTHALANALVRYATDQGLRTAHGLAGRTRVLDRFTNEATWARWLSLYSQ